MKTILRLILIPLFVLIAIPVGIYMLVVSSLPRKRARPTTVADVDRAEKKLGFALPEELRSFFLQRPKMRRKCAERYSVSEAVHEYRMLTKRPYGPNGQDWPRNLFPFADMLPGYASFDLDSGTVVEWDPEDLGEEDDRPILWDRSFLPTGMTLEQWLADPRDSSRT